MTLLALDLGTKCGWAMSTNIQVQSGTEEFSRKGDSEGMRYVRFEAWLNGLLVSWPDLIVQYERPIRFPGRPVGYGEKFSAILMKWCAEKGVECGAISPTEIKKHASGSGRCKKTEMIGLAQARWPALNIKDDNEADAVWLLSLVTQQLGVLPILDGYCGNKLEKSPITETGNRA